MPFQIALLYDKMLKGMPLNIISYKKAIWKGIEGHLKGIVQKLEDSRAADLGELSLQKMCVILSIHPQSINPNCSEITREYQILPQSTGFGIRF